MVITSCYNNGNDNILVLNSISRSKLSVMVVVECDYYVTAGTGIHLV